MRTTKRTLFTAPVFIAVLIAMTLGFHVDGFAQQVKSDYEIQNEFKKEFKKISTTLEQTDSSAAVQQVISDIKTLDENYSEHEELLNVALYPDTYQAEMEQLKKRALSIQSQLATIEEQEVKLQQLSSQVTSYDTRLNVLNKRTDSLQNAMRKSLQSEEQLSGMVRRYRESLEQRDDLILSFVDSVMITYQKLNVESMQDLENAKKKARFNAEGNALKMIQDIANENITLLDSDPSLTAEEYLRMSSVHQEFKTMWSKIGTKLVDIYADGEQEAKDNIGSAIENWDNKLSTQTWAAIDSSFESSGIQLPKFTDSDTFYETLTSYLDESIKASKNSGMEDAQSQYQNFSMFWTERVQAEWTPHIMDAGILSSQQMATIDGQLEQWASNAQPESRLLVYLLGISALAIVALGVMLVREKRSNKA